MTNEERIVQDVRTEEFYPVGEPDVPAGIATDIAEGRRDFEDLFVDAIDVRGIKEAIEQGEASERIEQVGERFLRRFAAACKTEICSDRPNLFELDSKTLAASLTPIIAGVLAGALVLSAFVPLAVLVALFIADVGLEVYCPAGSSALDVTGGTTTSTDG